MNLCLFNIDLQCSQINKISEWESYKVDIDFNEKLPSPENTINLQQQLIDIEPAFVEQTNYDIIIDNNNNESLNNLKCNENVNTVEYASHTFVCANLIKHTYLNYEKNDENTNYVFFEKQNTCIGEFIVTLLVGLITHGDISASEKNTSQKTETMTRASSNLSFVSQQTGKTVDSHEINDNDNKDDDKRPPQQVFKLKRAHELEITEEEFLKLLENFLNKQQRVLTKNELQRLLVGYRLHMQSTNANRCFVNQAHMTVYEDGSSDQPTQHVVTITACNSNNQPVNRIFVEQPNNNYNLIEDQEQQQIILHNLNVLNSNHPSSARIPRTKLQQRNMGWDEESSYGSGSRIIFAPYMAQSTQTKQNQQTQMLTKQLAQMDSRYTNSQTQLSQAHSKLESTQQQLATNQTTVALQQNHIEIQRKTLHALSDLLAVWGGFKLLNEWDDLADLIRKIFGQTTYRSLGHIQGRQDLADSIHEANSNFLNFFKGKIPGFTCAVPDDNLDLEIFNSPQFVSGRKTMFEFSRLQHAQNNPAHRTRISQLRNIAFVVKGLNGKTSKDRLIVFAVSMLISALQHQKGGFLNWLPNLKKKTHKHENEN